MGKVYFETFQSLQLTNMMILIIFFVMHEGIDKETVAIRRCEGWIMYL